MVYGKTIKLFPQTVGSQPLARNRLRLLTSSSSRQCNLFVYGGQRLQAGRNAIGRDNQDLCLRLLPTVGNEAKNKRISGKHLRIFIREDKAFILDLDSRGGTMVDGKLLTANTPCELSLVHKIKVAGILELRATIIEPREDISYNIAGVGTHNDRTPAIFIERIANTIEHCYILVPARIGLEVDKHGVLKPASSASAEILFVSGSLWLYDSKLGDGKCQVLTAGSNLQIDGHPVSVREVRAEDQK